jgi:positive regulator of sigma E activity
MTDRMVARGRVLAAHADGRLAVELTGQEACPGCRCGRLALASNVRRAELVLDGPTRVRIGEEILVTMPAAAVFRGALWLHGLPLAGLLTGAAAAAAVGFGDLGCLAGAVTGLTGALLLLRRIQRRWYSDAATGLRVAPTV